MAKFTKSGNWYVDGYYGNDTTGTGTKENPFKTMVRAHTAASTGHKVICRGWFYDIVPDSKLLHWEAEGLAMIDGSSFSTGTAFGYDAWGSITGFWFFNWTDGKLAVARPSTAKPVQDCRFDYCSFSSSASAATLLVKGCIFNECVIGGQGQVNMIGCTSTNCSGRIDAAGTPYTSFVMKDNIFHLCETLGMEFPTNRPPAQEFNYNCITGKLSGKTNAEWQAFGDGAFQAMGLAVPATDIFNDYSAGRDSGTYWMQDFTIKPTSPVADGSSIGLEMGAKRIGYRFNTAALWNTYKESSTNISYSATRGLILLDVGIGAGEYVSTWIPVLAGGMQFDMLNLTALFVNDANGNAVQFIQQNADAAPSSTVNQRRAFDVDFAVSSNNTDAPVWKKQEFYRRIRLDGSGNGIADNSYNPTVVQIPQGSFFKIRFTLRNVTV